MTSKADAELIGKAAERLYGDGQRIWDPADRWNQEKVRQIDTFGKRHAKKSLRQASLVLDLGCGRDGYGWIPLGSIGVDRFASQVQDRQLAVVADIEALPFADGVADFVVCVGSVINYVSAAEALREIARVTRAGGTLLLHFETSTSFEHLGRPRWGAPVVRIETENSGRNDTIWVYRPEYLYDLLKSFGFRIVHRRAFHIGSALGLRLGLGQPAAALLASLDPLLRWAARFADDVILIAEKAATTAGADAV